MIGMGCEEVASGLIEATEREKKSQDKRSLVLKQ